MHSAAGTSATAARKSDGRLQAMQGMAAAAQAYGAGKAIASDGILVKGEIGIGFASSSNSSNVNGSTAVGSTIHGGNNVTMTSTAGDIHATGANLGAGKTLSLDSARNIILDASQSTAHADGKNHSAGAEVGVGFQAGAQGTGVYAYAAANVGNGHNKSDSTTYNNTQLKADTINITSKGDTTLRGATATANTINADVGGKLAIESLQDVSHQDSSQTNVGGRVQVSFGSAWNASGNVSQSNTNGSSASVGQQSGLFAGDGGYHVKANTVDLKGGAIASTNKIDSELTTNKLTATDLENRMSYSAGSVSMAGSIGGGSGKGDTNADGSAKPKDQQQLFGERKSGNVAPGLPVMEKGSDSSTTYATVTDGKISIGGVTTNSVKDLGINNDASKASTALDKLPDLKKVLAEQQAMSAAAGTVLATSKEIVGDIAANVSKAAGRDGAAAIEMLKDQTITKEQRVAAEKTIAEAQQTQADWGAGGIYNRALNAGVVALVGGMAGQDGGKIVADAAGPSVAKAVGDIGVALADQASKDAVKYVGLAKTAKENNDLAAAADYEAKAKAASETATNWGDNGVYRVGLHAATQAMLGGLSNGGTGALDSAVGVVGGNLGQQLGAEMGNAKADELGLTGEKRAALVNAYQNTGAVVGGMLAGAAAAGATGQTADAGALLAAAQGGDAAGTVDANNRQLHPDDKVALKRLQKYRSPEQQQRLADAACALTHCAAGLSDQDPAKAAALEQERRGQNYQSEQEMLKSTGQFGYSKWEAVGDLVDRSVSRTKLEAQSVGRGAVNMGYQILTHGPGGNIQPPSDPFDETNGPRGPTGTAGATVIPSVPVCMPGTMVCVLTPPVVAPGTRGYVPSNVFLSEGAGHGDVSDGVSSTNSGVQGGKIKIEPGAIPGAVGQNIDNINRSNLGELLGRGGNKDVFAYGDTEAVGILRAGKNPDLLTEELSLLRKIDELGLPTVNARGPVAVDGQPSLLFDRFAQGSKDVVRLQDGKVRIVGDSGLLNERSIADLQAIRETMIKNNIKIDDLQFLVGKDGRVVIADPLGVKIGVPPSKNNLRMIDLLIEQARKAKK